MTKESLKKDKDISSSLRIRQSNPKWKKFKESSMNNVIRVGSAIGNNRFLVAIRDAFMLPFTLTTGAAIPLIFANLFFAKDSVLTGLFPSIKETEGMYWVNQIVGMPLADVFWAVMAGFSIYLCVGMGYFLAKSYGKDGIIAASLAVAVFFAMKPLESLGGTISQITIDGVIQTIPDAATTFATNYIGNGGMIIALLASMLAIYIYVKLMDVKWLIPKLPESVPPVVAKAFAGIFVSSIVLMTFAFINQTWFIIATEAHITGTVTTSVLDPETHAITVTTIDKNLTTIFAALEYVIAAPLMKLSSNIGATIVIAFLVAFFWFFGIHGTNILTPVTSVIWDVNVLKNTAYWVAWKKAHDLDPTGVNNYWTDIISVGGLEQHGLMPIPMAGLGYVGGTGATLGFLVGILIFSKSKVHRDIAKIASVPGLFGINEPVSFGVPIVLNPIYFVPYVLGFTLVYTMGHVWILIHMIRPAVVWTPMMPFGINVVFATDFDWWSLLAAVIQFGFSFLIWLPFVFIGPKYQEKVEQARIETERIAKEAKALARAEAAATAAKITGSNTSKIVKNETKA